MSQAGNQVAKTEECRSPKGMMLYICDNAQDAIEISLVVEKLVYDAEEKSTLSQEHREEYRELVSGTYKAIRHLFDAIRERLDSIMGAATDIVKRANPKEGREKDA